MQQPTHRSKAGIRDVEPVIHQKGAATRRHHAAEFPQRRNLEAAFNFAHLQQLFLSRCAAAHLHHAATGPGVVFAVQLQRFANLGFQEFHQLLRGKRHGALGAARGGRALLAEGAGTGVAEARAPQIRTAVPPAARRPRQLGFVIAGLPKGVLQGSALFQSGQQPSQQRLAALVEGGQPVGERQLLAIGVGGPLRHVTGQLGNGFHRIAACAVGHPKLQRKATTLHSKRRLQGNAARRLLQHLFGFGHKALQGRGGAQGRGIGPPGAHRRFVQAAAAAIDRRPLWAFRPLFPGVAPIFIAVGENHVMAGHATVPYTWPHAWPAMAEFNCTHSRSRV